MQHGDSSIYMDILYIYTQYLRLRSISSAAPPAAVGHELINTVVQEEEEVGERRGKKTKNNNHNKISEIRKYIQGYRFGCFSPRPSFLFLLLLPHRGTAWISAAQSSVELEMLR